VIVWCVVLAKFELLMIVFCCSKHSYESKSSEAYAHWPKN